MCRARATGHRRLFRVRTRATPTFGIELVRLAIQQVVHHRDHQQGQHRRDQQAADHGDRHRRAHFRAFAERQRQRHEAEQRGHRGHDDRAQARARAFHQRGALGHACSRSWLTLSIRMIAFFTTRPTSRIRPMNTTTDAGERGQQQRGNRTDQGQRDGEQDHERMQQRFELRGHHQVDQEDRQAEREQQRADRFIELLALATDMHRDVGAERRLGHHRFDFADRIAQVDIAQVGRDDRHPPLVGAVDFARTGGRHHLGHRGQFHRCASAGIDDQAADVIQRGAVGFLRTHQHVDLAITEAVAGRHVAAHLVDHHVGDLPGGQPQSCRAILVEHDLDLGKALLHGRLHVGIVRIATQQLGEAIAGVADRRQVAAFDFDFQRRREAEQLGPGEIDLRPRVRLHGLAQRLGERAFGIVAGHHHRQLADVLAAFGRAGIQSRAGARHAVQHAHAIGSSAWLRLHGADQRIGLRERRARRQLGGHLEAILRELRDQVGAQQRNREHGQPEGDRGDRQHRHRARQGVRQHAQVTAFGAMVGRHRDVAGLAHHRSDHRRDRTPCAHDGPGNPEEDTAENRPDATSAGRHRLLPTALRRPARVRRLLPGSPAAAGP